MEKIEGEKLGCRQKSTPRTRREAGADGEGRGGRSPQGVHFAGADKEALLPYTSSLGTRGPLAPVRSAVCVCVGKRSVERIEGLP